MAERQPIQRATRKRNFSRVFVIVLFLASGNVVARPQWFTPSVKDLVEHKGFNWQSADTANFRFYYEPGTFGEQHIEQLKGDAETSRTRVLTLLGEQVYRERISIFVLSSRERMKALIGKEINGVALPQRNAVLYVFSETTNASGAHELCHVFAKNLWGKADDWVNEGFAVYADDQWQQYELHAVAKHLLAKNKLIPLAELIKHFDKYSELNTYPECGSLVKFLYEKYGRDKVRQIWQQGPGVIPSITGKKLNELEKEWFVTIEQADASKVKYFAPRIF
jgi:hypothetical protein